MTNAVHAAVIAELTDLAREMDLRNPKMPVTADDVRGRIEQLTKQAEQPRATGTGIAQTPWEPSVVGLGHRITGRDVSYGRLRTGTVITVIGPIGTPDCGGYRYRLHCNGTPTDPIVYAERWA